MVWQAHFLSTNSEVKPLPLCEWWWMCGLTGVPRQCRHSAPQQLPQGATWRGVVCAGLQRGGPALEVPPEFRESCCWASSFLREVIINGSCSYHLLKYSGWQAPSHLLPNGRVTQNWVWIPASPLTRWVTLGKGMLLTGFQFLLIWSGDSNTSYPHGTNIEKWYDSS